MTNYTANEPSSATGNKKCAYCNLNIKGLIIHCGNQNYHPNHFKCDVCGKLLNEKKFKTKNDQPYCNTCFEDLFLKKCAKCKKTITKDLLVALGKTWHANHFCCNICKTNLVKSQFKEVQGNALCFKCFEKNRIGKMFEKDVQTEVNEEGCKNVAKIEEGSKNSEVTEEIQNEPRETSLEIKTPPLEDKSRIQREEQEILVQEL